MSFNTQWKKGACFLCHVTNLVTWFLERIQFEKKEGKTRLFKDFHIHLYWSGQCELQIWFQMQGGQKE